MWQEHVLILGRSVAFACAKAARGFANKRKHIMFACKQSAYPRKANGARPPACSGPEYVAHPAPGLLSTAHTLASFLSWHVLFARARESWTEAWQYLTTVHVRGRPALCALADAQDRDEAAPGDRPQRGPQRDHLLHAQGVHVKSNFTCACTRSAYSLWEYKRLSVTRAVHGMHDATCMSLYLAGD